MLVILLAGCAEPGPRGGIAEDSASRPVEVRADSGLSPRELVGRCAYWRADGEYLGRIVEAGPLGYANMPGQRRVVVEGSRLGRLAMTYPRNVRVGSCPPGAQP